MNSQQIGSNLLIHVIFAIEVRSIVFFTLGVKNELGPIAPKEPRKPKHFNMHTILPLSLAVIKAHLATFKEEHLAF